MSVALRKNLHQGSHDFLPSRRRGHLRLVPRMHQEIGRDRAKNTSVARLEYDSENHLLARYTHSGLRTDDVLAADITAAGQAAGLAQNSGSYQYLRDAQGTITDVVDNSGNKLQHYIYSAFGELLGIHDAQANDVTANPPLRTSFTYTGREYDSESGFYYYRARFYDSAIGKFLSTDPKPGALNIPATVVNSYAYVGNNPANVLDPTGQGWWSDWGRTAFITAVIITAAAFTGGAAAGLLGAGLGSTLGISAAAGGAIVGAAVGGVVAGGLRATWNLAEHRTWSDGVLKFAIMGAIAGGMAGYNKFPSASSSGSRNIASTNTGSASRLGQMQSVPDQAISGQLHKGLSYYNIYDAGTATTSGINIGNTAGNSWVCDFLQSEFWSNFTGGLDNLTVATETYVMVICE